MTPFERNLEVWRQLWRVIERSDIVVQIVDARNPLLFRSEDLELYVKDVESNKANLLLVNKADMMTYRQRKTWAEYFKKAGIAYKFFSAHLAKELNEARELQGESEEEEEEEEEEGNTEGGAALQREDNEESSENSTSEEDEDEDEDEEEEEEEEEGRRRGGERRTARHGSGKRCRHKDTYGR